MIDAALFPPHWLTETDDSALIWPCPFSRPEDVWATVRFVAMREDGETAFDELGLVMREPTDNGSHLVIDEDGVTMHLTQEDKALMAGRPVVFALTVVAAGQVDEAGGQLILSDWAVAPHKGTA